MKSLADSPRRTPMRVAVIGGSRSFRRRLMEMGLVPGTEVAVIGVAPLGDPLQIEVRSSRWSIRRIEAEQIAVTDVAEPARG